MEVEEIQSQACKYSRIGNGRIDSSKMSRKDQYPDDEEDGEHQQQQQQQQQRLQLIKRATPNDSGGGLVGDSTLAVAGGGNRLRGWHHSSRIIRVSRASGGKDRHSKVWTSKGLRDRRVRLSVTTAIQFYDLQDRLGYDQPSKAVEWLIKAAADSIAELPSLNTPFPETPKQLSDEKRGSEGTDQQGFDSVELDIDGDPNASTNYQTQNQTHHRSLSKSACSSNSETSKGSGLSLSRSELRVNRDKARERARERAAKEKDQKENESQLSHQHHHHHNVNDHPISQSSSFTELLTGGVGSNNNNNNAASPRPTTAGSAQQEANEEPNFFHKGITTAASRPWPAVTPMDYFNSGLVGPSSSSSRPPHHQFSGQIQLGSSNSLPQAMPIPPFSITNENHHHQAEMQHFSFAPDHLIPVTATQQGGPGGGDYNLNFTISSGLAGFNRGTLQSNSSVPSLLPHFQRFGSSSSASGSAIDGSNVNVPFFIGTAPPPVDHHQFPAGFDGRLHLYYGDGSRHSNQKGKGKN